MELRYEMSKKYSTLKYEKCLYTLMVLTVLACQKIYQGIMHDAAFSYPFLFMEGCMQTINLVNNISICNSMVGCSIWN